MRTPRFARHRGAATTEFAAALVVLIPVLLYGLYLSDALLLGLRIQQVAIHEVWDSTGLRVHRYANSQSNSASNADAYVNRVVQVADDVRDHTERRYRRLNPFSPVQGVGTFAVLSPTLDLATTPDPEQPQRPGVRGDDGVGGDGPVSRPTMGARARVEFYTYDMTSTFQPHLDPVFPAGAPKGPRAEMDAAGLLRRDYGIKGQAGITVRTTPLSQTQYQLLGEKKAVFDPADFRTSGGGGPLELRLCAVGVANEQGRCTISNGFVVLVDDWAVGDGRPHMMTGAQNAEYFNVVERMYLAAAELDNAETAPADSQGIGFAEAGLRTSLPHPKPVLYFQGADQRRSIPTSNGSDNIYTTPNNPYVSGPRSGCYLGMPCWVTN
ncbi:hypothetical protein [Hyalangium versicolor]|uniref:hypothetical protein n=1 Tax=Hyalangium versicolor TaxID=2861190 RepID=UPI001CCC4CD7|nr:hypothetical protein [Hyalangium versicolor]